jgi:hypothetical protein
MITIADWDEIIKDKNLSEFADEKEEIDYERTSMIYKFKERAAKKTRKRPRRACNER